ncbi:MAG: hypothetical protein WBN92_02155 [Terriglobia bacterium]
MHVNGGGVEIEEEYLDVYQNIESAIVVFYEEDSTLLDLEVIEPIAALIRYTVLRTRAAGWVRPSCQIAHNGSSTRPGICENGASGDGRCTRENLNRRVARHLQSPCLRLSCA